MRVFGPIRVEVAGLFQRKHRFVSTGRVLGELETASLSQESQFREADGQQFVIQREGLLTDRYTMRQGNLELATVERMDITYRAVPYHLSRAGLLGPYQLRNEQDAVVLEITKPSVLISEIEIEMLQDGDLLLVVLAYFLMRRHLQRRRSRAGASD